MLTPGKHDAQYPSDVFGFVHRLESPRLDNSQDSAILETCSIIHLQGISMVALQKPKSNEATFVLGIILCLNT